MTKRYCEPKKQLFSAKYAGILTDACIYFFKNILIKGYEV